MIVTHSAAAPKEPPIIRLKYMLPGTMMKATKSTPRMVLIVKPFSKWSGTCIKSRYSSIS